MASDDNDSTFDPTRRLCPDGGCIGVIGPDGKCTVCGKEAPAGDPATPPMSYDEPDHFDDASSDADSPPDTSGFDPKRRLCSDDTCIGVIGADNRCCTCGKPADG